MYPQGQPTTINATNHKDLITAVEQSADGTLLATASLDKVVNIYRRKSRHEEWELVETLKSHSGYVSTCRFTHPFRGRILATASFDTKIHIFQEDETKDGYSWKSRAVLNCINSAVTDIQFCPYYFQSMFLAACTSNGHLLVFEAPDPLNIVNWNSLYEIRLGDFKLSTLSWDRNRFTNHPYIAVGSNDPSAPAEKRLTLFEIDLNKQMLTEQVNFDLGPEDTYVNSIVFAPSSCALYSRLAVATCFHVHIYAIMYEKLASTNKYHVKDCPVLIGRLESATSSFEIVSLLWNNQGSSLSVQYNDGRIFIYQQMFNHCWKQTAIISPQEVQDGLPTRNFINY